MPDKGGAQVAENGEVETTDPKAPLADEEEEEEIGDPVPANVQAVLSLCGIVAAIMVAMGLASSEWVIAVDGYYWQGLFVYCAGSGYSGSGSGEDSSESSSSSSSSSASAAGSGSGSGSGSGCYRIDLGIQGYTMMAALFISVSLASNIFGFILAMLGSWVKDIDSKRKSYKLSLYLWIVCIISCGLSLFIYSACFGELMEDVEELGPFKKPKDEWEIGWSFEVIVAGLVFQIITTLCVGYSLLMLPIIEEVEEEEEEEKK
ncbi:hypothetical protein Fcan01_07737 [Folsomia candida]|uniref:Transmembrane protein 47 n=1 Tax=Folsomia candida TaxID=158441 RepID=A0A226EI02_FOLCA|nr:hypothetical protein Fcan01_07737 [Folsomia candida]